jgi:hypothetical protein
MKISIEMEPRELHEVMLLAASMVAPEEPRPAPVRVESRRKITHKAQGKNYRDNLPVPTKDIREWAKVNGFHPAKGGTLPKDMIDAWIEAHS